MPLGPLSSNSFQPDQVAIAVGESALGPDGHLALGFHPAKAGPHILHLAWHEDLRVESAPVADFCWAAEILPIPAKASKQVVAYIRAIATKHPSIGYGINLLAGRGSFGPTGKYKAPKGSDGLTCSTFVTDILRGGGVDLVQLGTWIDTPENRIWCERICNFLTQTKKDPQHIANVRANISGLRLRPYEVAGAARLGRSSWPAAFDAVQAPAAAVRDEFFLVCPIRGQSADREHHEHVSGEEAKPKGETVKLKPPKA